MREYEEVRGITKGVRRTYEGSTRGVRREYEGSTRGVRREYKGVRGSMGSTEVSLFPLGLCSNVSYSFF
jgi:hypothetical protein